MEIRIPVKKNTKLKKIVDKANKDLELNTYWECANKIAIDRMHLNDHGKVHLSIVANIALRMHQLLQEQKVKFSLVEEDGLSIDDSEVAVFLGCILHDVGHIVHRSMHEEFSVSLAKPIMERLLDGIYEGREKYLMIAEVLHIILAHSKKYRALTIEAGLLRVADALDMKKGRARIPFTLGEVSIHSLSALAILEVKLKKGDKRRKEKPIKIDIIMENPAGIFQIDNLLKEKIKNSGLEKYISVEACVKKGSKIEETIEYSL